MNKFSVFDWHQIRIAKRTLKLSDAGASILGSMSKEEARNILRKHGVRFTEVRSSSPSRTALHKSQLRVSD